MTLRTLEPEPPASRSVRRLLTAVLAAGLILACLWVLMPFLASIAWAAILAYVSWPAYRRVRRPFGRSANAAALVMILALTCVLLVPLLWLLMLLRNELMGSLRPIAASLSEGIHDIVDGIRRVPWLGARVEEELRRYLADPSLFAREAMNLVHTWLGALASLVGGLGRHIAQILITLLLLFFFFRDGERIARELGRAAKRLFGRRYTRYASAAGAITRAMFFGILLSAAAQGLIAGLGYRLAGLRAPVLLGALTAIAAVIPLVGTALLWVPIAIGLVVAGDSAHGLLLLAWGTLLVHPIDNLLRPLLVSNAVRLPFLLVALGAIGGMIAFGLIGLFAGPILLGLALTLWQEWNESPGR